MRNSGHSRSSSPATPRGAYTASFVVASRSSSKPRVWSISPSVQTAALIGVPRAPRGQSSGRDATWTRRSGDAFSSTQRAPSALTATEDCVRPVPLRRASWQLRQPQFHCGNPPPAAEPRMMTRIDERSEEHTSELQSPCNLVCRLLLEKKKKDL